MKRVISIFLTLALLIGCFVISVSANGLSDFSNDCTLNLMDFNEFNPWFFDSNSSELTQTIYFPEYRVYYGFDFIFADNADITAVYLNHPSLGRVPMQLFSIGSNLKRAILSGSDYQWGQDFVSFTFVKSREWGSPHIQINSFYVNFYNVNHFSTSCIASGFTPTSSIDLSLNVGDSRPTQVTWSITDFNNSTFSFDIYSPDWRKFDFIDFQFITTIKSINSLSCVFGDIILPFSSSYTSLDSSGKSTFLLSVRVDVRGLDKGSSLNPTLVITGNSVFDNLNAFKLADCSGFVYLNQVNPFFYYFKDLKVKLDILFFDLGNTIVSSFNPDDNGSADQFHESVSSQAGELSGIADAMGSLDKPDPDSLNVNLDSFAVNANISGVGSVLAVPMRNSIILQVLIMTFTFALVGYALFGKR